MRAISSVDTGGAICGSDLRSVSRSRTACAAIFFVTDVVHSCDDLNTDAYSSAKRWSDSAGDKKRAGDPAFWSFNAVGCRDCGRPIVRLNSCQSHRHAVLLPGLRAAILAHRWSHPFAFALRTSYVRVLSAARFLVMSVVGGALLGCIVLWWYIAPTIRFLLFIAVVNAGDDFLSDRLL